MGSVYGRDIKGVHIRAVPFGCYRRHGGRTALPGHKIDLEELRAFMQRRAPGNSSLSTPRKEADEFEILSGLVDGRLCGAPFTAIIRNTNTRPGDYESINDTPRPGHADYTAEVKYGGAQDKSGGGHFSGRLTAPLCIVGGICIQLLKEKSIFVGSHIERVGNVKDKRFDPVNVGPEDFIKVLGNFPPVIDAEAGVRMAELINKAREDCDSVGGAIECAVVGPACRNRRPDV